MKDRYGFIETPTLLIVGSTDRLLPSGTEGKRLAKEMRRTKVDLQEFDDRG
jgi:pimeloyl-ACP methyl ester carboxylesterase